MRLHGWALCLGALIGGSALAQPPANSERFPVAPTTPSSTPRVIPAGGGAGVPRPTVTTNHYAIPKAATTTRPISEPKPLVLPTSTPVPYSPVVTTSTSNPPPLPAGVVIPPGQTVAVPGTGCDNCKPACPTPGCAVPGCSSHTSKILDWLTFRSGVTKWGCKPTPYQPSLQAWFPCDSKSGTNCTSCATMPGTVVGSTTNVLPPATETINPPAKSPAAAPQPMAPTNPAPLPGMPKEPKQMPPTAPKIGGLNFNPGGAPMAAPTTQVGKPTKFQPK